MTAEEAWEVIDAWAENGGDICHFLNAIKVLSTGWMKDVTPLDD